MFYFNFHELQVNCEDQIPAIFVLTVGLSLEYNNYTFNNIIDFRYKCFDLVDIPTVLFRRRLIRKTTDKQYQVLYRTKNPQSYISNKQVLFVNYPIEKKVQYIKLLSYRAINNNNNWIPTDYIEDLTKISNNELLNIHNNKIYFKYEGKQLNVTNQLG
jgi:hypothetical protein